MYQVSWRLPDSSWQRSRERAEQRRIDERLALARRRRKACWQRGMLTFTCAWSLFAAIELAAIVLARALL